MKIRLTALLFIGVFSMHASAQGFDSQSVSLNALPETDFTFQPNLGAFFQMDASGLFSLSLNPGLLFIDRFFGDTYTYLLMMAGIAPYSSMLWPHYADGALVDPNSPDFANTYFSQGRYSLSATLYQGLWHDSDRPLLGNIINVFIGYTVFYSDNYETINPDAYIFKSALADKDEWLGNIVKTGIEFKDVSVNRLFNTRRGSVGKIEFEWAPIGLGNDILGKTDFTRISAYIGHSLPLLENKLVSATLVQKGSFEIKRGSAIPVAAHYGAAAASGMAAVRKTLIPDNLMQAVYNLNVCLFFPTAFESGMIPGVSAFCDFGFHDDYDYRFSFERIQCTAGLAFTVHLDSSSIIPLSMLMDINVGARYDFKLKKALFYFDMILSQ